MDEPIDQPIDIEALAREAGLPSDEPGLVLFAQLVAERCACICETMTPDGEASHVPEAQVQAVSQELGVKIRALFGGPHLRAGECLDGLLAKVTPENQHGLALEGPAVGQEGAFL